MTHMIETTIKI